MLGGVRESEPGALYLPFMTCALSMTNSPKENPSSMPCPFPERAIETGPLVTTLATAAPDAVYDVDFARREAAPYRA